MAFSNSFRAARWLRTLNLVLQAALFLTFFAGLNYVAGNHPALRFDLTRRHNFSLSPETLSYLKNLGRPVQIVVTIADKNDEPQLSGLLDEFKHATETNPAGGKITVEYLDVYQERRKAEQYGIDSANVILLRCGDKPRVLPIDDLYRVENKRRVAFQGEQVLTGAILEVSSPDRQKIYFLTGHQEAEPGDPSDRGLTGARDQLRFRNFEVDKLELAVARKVPADAKLLIAVDPKSACTPAEQELLRQYLSSNAGRLILLLAPGKPSASLGLDELLLDWGVLADDDVVIDAGRDFVTDDGDLMVRFFDEKHPITQQLVSYKAPLRLSLARTVRPDPGRSLGNGVTTVSLAWASPAAWGERSYREMFRDRTLPAYDRGIDIRPVPGMESQLAVAVASERVSARDNLPFSVRGGRLVVFGTGDMVSNARVAIAGNLAMFFGAVNWTVDRDRYINVPARPLDRFTLALSAGDLHKLNYSLWFVLPGITAVLGLMVYWTRRS